VIDKWVPVVAIASPVISFFISKYSEVLFWGYKFGFEILILNGLITMAGLLLISLKTENRLKIKNK
jgi:solute:Na+ symporter, SSS family